MPRKTPSVLQDPLVNRGTAFTASERAQLGLIGRLPAAVSTLEQQANRAYAQLQARSSDLAKNQFMASLQDSNEVLFYRLLVDHLVELNPIVYDPTVGDAIEQYSHEFRRPRGVYLSIDHPGPGARVVRGPRARPRRRGPDRGHRRPRDPRYRGLGRERDRHLRRQTGGLHRRGGDPSRPGDRGRLGLRYRQPGAAQRPAVPGEPALAHHRKAYDDFIALYLKTVSELFPNALYHFEDFGPSNARRILDDNAATYRIFNDDVQGTGAIVLAAVISALKVTGQSFRDQRLVVFGSGTAGCGIADSAA